MSYHGGDEGCSFEDDALVSENSRITERIILSDLIWDYVPDEVDSR